MEFSDSLILSNDQLVSLMIQYIAYLNVHEQIHDPGALIRDIFNDQQSHDRVMYSMLSHMASYGLPENFPDDGSIFNTTSQLYCSQINGTVSEEILMGATSFWVEGIGQALVGILGIIGNVLAISIYRAGGNKFSTIFYQVSISSSFYICLLCRYF
jgi:hypothetical protein